MPTSRRRMAYGVTGLLVVLAAAGWSLPRAAAPRAGGSDRPAATLAGRPSANVRYRDTPRPGSQWAAAAATPAAIIGRRQEGAPPTELLIVGVILLLQASSIGAWALQRRRYVRVQAQNDAILRAMPDMMFVQDGSGVYLGYHAANPAELAASPECFLGKKMSDVLPQPALQQIQPSFDRAARGRQPTIVEYSLDLDGRLQHFEARLVPCGERDVLSVVRNISERKQGEMAARERQLRYTLATTAGGVGIWDLALSTGRLYVDESVRRALGFSGEDDCGSLAAWMAHVHPDDVGRVVEPLDEVVAGNTPFYEAEYRMVRTDGGVRWFLFRASQVRDETGVPSRVVGTVTDVTARKASEQALADTRAELARVSRLTALGEFAAVIAHEVSQPLSAILTNTATCQRLLDRGTASPAEIKTIVDEIASAGWRANQVIAHNRELFARKRVIATPTDLNEVIAHAMILMHPRFQAGDIAVDVHLGARLPHVLADSVEIEQVLLNFFFNAIDSMRRDGDGRRISVSSDHRDGGVEVRVRDTGIGLLEVDTARLFTTFYTTKAQGTGIGLAVSRAIVEAHGGSIWAEPNTGPGATFAFRLPVAAAQPA